MSRRALLLLIVALVACKTPDAKKENAMDATAPLPDAASVTTNAMDAGDATDASLDADVDARAASVPRDIHGKVVLHAGDSMVGGQAGLTKALAAKFEAAGAKFVSDSDVSVSISSYDKGSRLAHLLARHKPDIVILTLGANDVFVPFPDSLTVNVEHIAKKLQGRECYWMSPPTWKPDTGIVAIIRDHIAPCIFYDSTHLVLPRVRDGIHPTDKGGEAWADDFWDFFQAHAPDDVATNATQDAGSLLPVGASAERAK